MTDLGIWWRIMGALRDRPGGMTAGELNFYALGNNPAVAQRDEVLSELVRRGYVVTRAARVPGRSAPSTFFSLTPAGLAACPEKAPGLGRAAR
jgi:hypothetical protein